MNMLSAHINLRDVQSAASDIYFIRKNRQQPFSIPEYHDMQTWYTENHQNYAELPVFKECGFQLDKHGYIQCDKHILKRLQLLWASPRWTNKALSFTNRIDSNPTNYCSINRLNEVLKACVNQKQFIILHVTYLSFINHKELLVELSELNLLHLIFSIGSAQSDWRTLWEPGTKSYALRLENIKMATSAGIPCGILVEPVIPGESLQGLYELLRLASVHGIQWAGYRLWHSNFMANSFQPDANYSNDSQTQLKIGFISQFTHYCKRFALNAKWPVQAIQKNCEMTVFAPLLF